MFENESFAWLDEPQTTIRLDPEGGPGGAFIDLRAAKSVRFEQLDADAYVVLCYGRDGDPVCVKLHDPASEWVVERVVDRLLACGRDEREGGGITRAMERGAKKGSADTEFVGRGGESAPPKSAEVRSVSVGAHSAGSSGSSRSTAPSNTVGLRPGAPPPSLAFVDAVRAELRHASEALRRDASRRAG